MNHSLLLSTFYSDDMSRKGMVFKKDQGHSVELYENEQFVRTISLPDKSVYYAEDAAENWTMRIIKE